MQALRFGMPESMCLYVTRQVFNGTHLIKNWNEVGLSLVETASKPETLQQAPVVRLLGFEYSSMIA